MEKARWISEINKDDVAAIFIGEARRMGCCSNSPDLLKNGTRAKEWVVIAYIEKNMTGKKRIDVGEILRS